MLSNLVVSTEYCYKVSAVDASGNESSSGDEICADTLQSSVFDDETSNGNNGEMGIIQFTQLNYSAAESDGTAAISVSRTGNTTQAMSVDYELIGGTAIENRDFVVMSGRLQWQANDSTNKIIFVQMKADSNAESTETIKLLLNSTSTNAKPGNPSSATLSIEDSVCNGVIDADINQDTTITEPCNIVRKNVRVSVATLTINPGVTLIFEADTGFNISQNAALVAVGSEAKPILFTAKSPTAGYWNGIRFTFSNDIQNALKYATIEFGGKLSGDGANVQMIGPTGLPQQLRFENCTLSDSGGYGFSFF